MSIIIFLIILAILIFVHELGHFTAAKKLGMRVDEFAIGFRPKIWGKKKGETEYFLGLIPIGGYVRIFGENHLRDRKDMSDKDIRDIPRAFHNRPLWARALVLLAGVTFNILFAWVLISVDFMIGANVSASEFPKYEFEEVKVLVQEVIPGSPADKAGIVPGDYIISLGDGASVTASEISSHVYEADEPVELEIEGSSESVLIKKEILVDSGTDKEFIGITMETIGLIKMKPHQAMWASIKTTYRYTVFTTQSLFKFFSQVFVGKANLDQVSGPVGIVGVAGNAADTGFSALLFFTAIISINLAVINILPFPALDGGRLLFVVIEFLRKKPIKPSVANSVNIIGFAILILLMIIVTFNDISRMFFG